MKYLVLHITVLVIILIAFSCNNDFLSDKLEHVSPEYASIVISPDWPAQDYSMYCPDAENAKFKIVQKPNWLKIVSTSERFFNGFATLNCEANTNHEFSEIGFYYTYLTLAVEGIGNRSFLIAYITEGDPVVETEHQITIDRTFRGLVPVRNTGNGILLLSILQLPEWLSLMGNDGNPISIEEYPVLVLPPDSNEDIPFLINQTAPNSGKHSGKIIISSNDKNKPVVEIDIQIDLGNPVVEIKGKFI